MRLSLGRMRNRITIQQRTVSRDTDGAPLEAWSDYATVWAEIEQTGGREFYAAKQINSKLTHEIRIHYNAAIVSSMRVVWGTRTLFIESALQDEGAHRFTVLHCSEAA